MDLQGTEELWEVERLAQRIQVAREKMGAAPTGPHLSRSSLLVASLLHDEGVRAAIQSANLEMDEFSSRLGLPMLPSAPDSTRLAELLRPHTGEGRPVDPDLLGPALEVYRDRFRHRPLDAAGLAWSVVAKPERGWVGRRLKEAHLDFDIAKRGLLEMILASDHPATGRARETAASEGLVHIEQLERLPTTGFVRGVFTWAAQAARDQGGDVLTSALVLFALVAAGGSDPEAGDNIGAFLFKILYRPAPERYKAAVDHYLSWYGQQPRSGRSSARQLSGISALTPYLWGAIGEAQRISDQVSAGETRVHARHLLAGLLSFRPTAGEATGTQQVLDQLEMPSPQVARHLFDYLVKNAPGEGSDDLEAWREILLAIEDEGTRGGHGFVLPRFDAEGLEGNDLLGIDKDVASFARLLAARSLEPPLAVGLFGDWGTGKSFFMKRLQRRIESLAALARRADEIGQGSAFHRDVVQVEFNAWHYVETNLWASLVTHIFETLNRHFMGPDGEEEQWGRLLEKLDEAQQLQSAAEQVLRRAKEELDRAHHQMEDTKRELPSLVRAAWESVLTLLGSPKAEALERDLGKSGTAELRDQLLKMRRESDDVLRRWWFFRAAFLRAVASLSSLGWIGAAVAVATLLLVIAAGVDDGIWYRQALTRLAEMVGLLGGLGGWLGSALARAQRAMDVVEEVERVVREDLENQPAGRALREAEAEVDAAAEEVEERRRRLRELRSQLEELRPGRRLSSFLAERAASSDYHQHLGLAAVVRRDFQKLHELMSHRVRFRVARAEAAAALNEGLVPASVRTEMNRIDQQPFPDRSEKDKLVLSQDDGGWWIHDRVGKRDLHLVPDGDAFECTVDWNLPNVERIILYIDDLDRCPPSRVVEVLQAIHLLLAFPLFVVVVAVDARWVSSALNLRYRRLWTGFEGTGSQPGPHDYLEKIFQIPFWLEPLDRDSTRDYLRGLLAGSVEERDRQLRGGDGPGEDGNGGRRGSPEDGHPDGPSQDEARSGAEAGEEGVAESEAADVSPPQVSEKREDPGRHEAFEELRPRSLELTPEEVEFIEILAPVVGRTPRAVKRFVNVYRLIRAGITGRELESFLAPSEGGWEFKALALLLAMLVGHPEQAKAVFEGVAAAPEEAPIGAVFDGLDVPSQAGEPEVRQFEGLRRLGEVLESLEEEGTLLPPVSELKPWLSTVSRYSFRLGPRPLGRNLEVAAGSPVPHPGS
jgi:hypothetical protein